MQHPIHAVRRLAATAFLILGLALSAGASARQVFWELQGVAFEDGGTVTGNFIYDSATEQFSTFALSISGGNTTDFPPVVMTHANSFASQYQGDDPQPTLLFELNDGSQRQLRITPANALTGSGGNVAINLDTAHNHSGGVECFNCGPARILTAGSLTGSVLALDAQALPMLDARALGLLALGLAGAAAYARRRLRA